MLVGSFNLFIEVVWVSVCQRDAKLQAGKAVGLKKKSATLQVGGPSLIIRQWDHP